MEKISCISEDFRGVQAIYALKQNSEIVYIGYTSDVYLRINQHIKSNKIFNDFSILMCAKRGDNKNKLWRECLEQCLISDYKPKYNKLMCKNSFEYMSLLPSETLKKLSAETYEINDFTIDYKNETKIIYELLKVKDYNEALSIARYINARSF